MTGSHRISRPIAALLLLLALAAAQYFLGGSASAQELIPADVSVAGVPIGGMDQQAAQAALQQQFSPALSSPITLTLGDRQWAIPLGQLGASLDLTATVAQAFSATLTMSSDQTPHDLPLLLTHDRAAADAALTTLAAQVEITPTNADIILTKEQLELVQDAPGATLDREATWQNIVSTTTSLPLGVTSTALVTGTITPTVFAASLTPIYDKAVAMAGQPITMTAPMSGTTMAFTVPTDALRSLIDLQRDSTTNMPTGVTLPDANIQAYAKLVGAQVDHVVENARLVLPDFATATEIQAEIAGRDLDEASTAKKLKTIITTAGAKRSMALPVKITPAKIVSADLEALKTKYDALIAHSIDLRYGGNSYALTPKQLVVALYLEADADGTLDSYNLRIEDKDLARVVSRAAAAIDVPAHDATYRLVRGRARLVQAAENGLSVDQDAALPLLRDALANGTAAIDLPTHVTTPDYGFGGLGSIAAPNLLAAGETFYGYSSPERNWNVTLGASRLDGWYVAPGATFSFNDALGPLTLDAGFKMGWAIQVQAGTATTIPSEAGGICQVATTLFQGAFRSGLDITERRNHSYWIATYGKPPSGLQGLDATVDPPWQDFKFANNTGNWILIRAHGDHQNIKVSIYGTNPGWDVQISDPVITDVVQPNRTPVYEYTDKLAAGRELKVETAQPGFKAQITRKVFKGDQLLDTYVATGQYLPSRDRTMVGTGK